MCRFEPIVLWSVNGGVDAIKTGKQNCLSSRISFVLLAVGRGEAEQKAGRDIEWSMAVETVNDSEGVGSQDNIPTSETTRHKDTYGKVIPANQC